MGSPLAFAGLVYDIAGVLLLGWALLIGRDPLLFRQAGTYWNGNKSLFRTLRVQRFDAKYGVTVMVTGFTGQALASAGLYVSWPLGLALVICLLPAFAIWLVARRRCEQQSDGMYDRLRKKDEDDEADTVRPV